MAVETLSAREAEVADLVAKGLTNEQIASMLGLSLQTVKNHLRSVFRKLQITNRVQLTVTILHRGGLQQKMLAGFDVAE